MSVRFKQNFAGMFWILLMTYFIICCNSGEIDSPLFTGRQPIIEPDYRGVTIPSNIAPMNFQIREEAVRFNVQIISSDGSELSLISSKGIVRFPQMKWKNILSRNKNGEIKIIVTARYRDGGLKNFSPFSIYVANEPADPYLVYRILYPGYEAWLDMKIIQRSIESFEETSLVENQLLDNNCVNCHSFCQNDPFKMLLHVRGSRSGTYFVDGKNIVRRSLKTENMPANAVYPSWHPSGRFVAFSSNKTVQAFHSRPEKNIEVFDLFSSLVLYDVENNQIMACNKNDTLSYMETFPYWSPDGYYLYYCRAPQVGEGFDFRDVKYDLVRIPFDPEKKSFGKTEILFNASATGKSVSFPAVSPEGNYVVFTLHDYGTFSIWHREADLYLLNITDGKTVKMSLNSDETESYHSWSSNSKWLVFSSKRVDGLSARPYLSYIYSSDSTGRPFVLPQKDPRLYKRMKKTFNKPEFVTGRISVSPRDFARASTTEPVPATWAGTIVLKSIQDSRYKNEKY